MAYCENCGTKLSYGTCSNCQEELYIFENQWHEDPFELSDEFKEKINEQKKERENNKIKEI